MIDQTTKLPIRHSVAVGDTENPTYFSYGQERKQLSDFTPDFFSVPEPDSYDMKQSADFRAQRTVGTVTDGETGSAYTPYGFGATAQVLGGTVCLYQSSIFRHSEPGTGDPSGGGSQSASALDLSELTRVEAIYTPLTGTMCSTQALAGGVAKLRVRSLARTSQFAAAYRRHIQDTAQQVALKQQDPMPGAGFSDFSLAGVTRTAYVISRSDGTSTAFIDIGNTSVIISGDFGLSDVVSLATKLEPK